MNRDEILNLFRDLADEFNLSCTFGRYTGNTNFWINSPYFDTGAKIAAVIGQVSLVQYVNAFIPDNLDIVVLIDPVTTMLNDVDPLLIRERLVGMLTTVDSLGQQLETRRIVKSADILTGTLKEPITNEP